MNKRAVTFPNEAGKETDKWCGSELTEDTEIKRIAKEVIGLACLWQILLPVP